MAAENPLSLDVRPEALVSAEEAVAATSGSHRFVVADVCQVAQVEEALEVAAELGPLHGLVHVAGGLWPQQWGSLLSLSLETFDDVLELNLRSALVTMRAMAARLVDQGGGGSIVSVSSVAALSAMPYGAAYAAAKAGLISLVRTPKSGSDENDELSGPERAAVALGRRGVPADVAGAVLFLLSGLSSWVTGQILPVDGGSSARPSFLGDDDLPVFVHNAQLRQALLGDAHL